MLRTFRYKCSDKEESLSQNSKGRRKSALTENLNVSHNCNMIVGTREGTVKATIFPISSPAIHFAQFVFAPKAASVAGADMILETWFTTT
jgi:hypothetical protein